MFPNLEAEQIRRGYTEEYVAERLGITRQEYQLRRKFGSFSESEVRELAAFYNQPVEYLFQLGAQMRKETAKTRRAGQTFRQLQ